MEPARPARVRHRPPWRQCAQSSLVLPLHKDICRRTGMPRWTFLISRRRNGIFPAPRILSAHAQFCDSTMSKFDARSRDQTRMGGTGKIRYPQISQESRTLVEGNVKRAVEHFEQAVSGCPRSARAGTIYAATGRRRGPAAAGEASQYFRAQATANQISRCTECVGQKRIAPATSRRPRKSSPKGSTSRTRNRSISTGRHLCRVLATVSPATRTTCPHNFNSWIAC